AVGNFTDRGAAVSRHFAHLTGAQTNCGVLAFAGYQLHGSAGAAGDLSTLARLHFQTVDHATDGNIAQWQSVTHLDGRGLARLQQIARLQPFGRNNVTALTILVADKGNVRSAVGVVLQTLNLANDAILVTLEIDDAIVLFVPTTHMTGSDTTGAVAPTGLALLLQQRRIGRTFVKVRIDDTDNKTTTW